MSVITGKATKVQLITMDGTTIDLSDGVISFSSDLDMHTIDTEPTLLGYPVKEVDWPKTFSWEIEVKVWFLPYSWFPTIKSVESEYLSSMEHGDKEVIMTYPRLLATTTLYTPGVRRFSS